MTPDMKKEEKLKLAPMYAQWVPNTYNTPRCEQRTLIKESLNVESEKTERSFRI